MTSNLCGENTNSWDEAEIATIESLQNRLNLWDGAYKQILKRNS